LSAVEPSGVEIERERRRERKLKKRERCSATPYRGVDNQSSDAGGERRSGTYTAA